MTSFRRDAILPVAAFAALWLIAFGLRTVGIDFGLPFLYHPDEAEIVGRALRLPLDGPNPGWFVYPSLALYAHAMVHAAIYGFGDCSSYGELVDRASRDPSTVYLGSRLLTAVSGATSVLFTGLAAFRFADERRLLVGLAAGALLCVFPLHVEHSHYATVDIPLSMFAAILAWQLARLAKIGAAARVRDYALAGVTVGLAASTKYPGALLGLGVAIAFALTVLREIGWKRGLLDWRLPTAAGASLAAFLATSPFVMLEPMTFLRDLLTELGHMRSGHLGFELEQHGWLTQMGNLYESGGPAFCLLLVAGACTAIASGGRFWQMAALTAVALLAIAGQSKVLFARYLLPIIPFCCLVASTPTSVKALRWIAAAVLALSLGDMSYRSWERDRLFTTEDTRTQAWHWAGSFPASAAPAVIAAEPNSFPYREARLAGSTIIPLEYDLSSLRAKGVKYVALSDRMTRRYRQAPEHYPAENEFYAELGKNARQAALFTPYPDVEGRQTTKIRSGPLVVVYELLD